VKNVAADGTTRVSRSTRRSARTPPSYLPSRREIAKRCREIQATWSPAIRRLRTVCRVDDLVLSPVHIELDPEGYARLAWSS
jgi:hypothetical protein